MSAGSEGAAAAFDVPEMDCPACAGKVEQSASKLDGNVNSRVASGQLTVNNSDATTADAIEDRIEKGGYSVEGRNEATVSLSGPGMDCGPCTGKAETALDRVQESRHTKPD
ncbi:cation transporter [Halobellus rarus]|uniref:cation transporter n=1 Tax=Halobellus rarus TaxID=1126237 RepID=UPI0021121632